MSNRRASPIADLFGKNGVIPPELVADAEETPDPEPKASPKQPQGRGDTNPEPSAQSTPDAGSGSPEQAPADPTVEGSDDRSAADGPALMPPSPADLVLVADASDMKGPSETPSAWDWSGPEMVRSHRFPSELLERLDEFTRQRNVPVGLTVAAALASLFERPEDEILALVHRAADARPRRLTRG